ncbi:MOSC domain-containing protein [Schlesneria sp. T3-172]|uniref:MOSC domain-containing protein n=1 Tax=Schlesneria sphaerica TaxID=3373610 RepID=UPI0037C59680
MKSLATLLNTIPQVGTLCWIGLRTERQGPINIVAEAELVADRGLKGDRRFTGRPGVKRQVTLIQSEHLPAVASLLHRTEIPPELLRRNLVVSGVNLLALKGRRFSIGDSLLEFSGPCEPCSKMEIALGPGGFNAMRGHGGITAMVLRGGIIRLGDAVQVIPQNESQD